MAVTSAILRRFVLDPAMDRRAISGRQEELLTELVELHRRGAEAERRICGFADRLVKDLHSRQVNGRGALAAKSIARALREPLRAADGAEPWAMVEAALLVERLLRGVPREQVFSPEVKHQLGKRKYAVLIEIDTRLREIAK
ncbi:MAG: hypothetical protein ACRD2Z_03260 [Thermoanaerobaculia bacterium]